MAEGPSLGYAVSRETPIAAICLLDPSLWSDAMVWPRIKCHYCGAFSEGHPRAASFGVNLVHRYDSGYGLTNLGYTCDSCIERRDIDIEKWESDIKSEKRRKDQEGNDALEKAYAKIFDEGKSEWVEPRYQRGYHIYIGDQVELRNVSGTETVEAIYCPGNPGFGFVDCCPRSAQYMGFISPDYVFKLSSGKIRRGDDIYANR